MSNNHFWLGFALQFDSCLCHKWADVTSDVDCSHRFQPSAFASKVTKRRCSYLRGQRGSFKVSFLNRWRSPVRQTLASRLKNACQDQMKLQLQRDKREADALLLSCYVGSLGIPSCTQTYGTFRSALDAPLLQSIVRQSLPKNLSLWCQQYFRCCHIKNALRSRWTLIIRPCVMLVSHLWHVSLTLVSHNKVTGRRGGWGHTVK